MTSRGSPNASKASTRSTRPRPTPEWLKKTDAELNQIAQRRCLQLLSVLSGEKSVSEAIAEMEVSRGTYYQLETRALHAMLAALAPGAQGTPEDGSPERRLVTLQEKVKKLEQTNRRLERLLFLTRQVVKPGPSKLGRGPRRNPSRAGQRRTAAGPSSTPTPPPASSGPSTPTKGGESGSSGGSAS